MSAQEMEENLIKVEDLITQGHFNNSINECLGIIESLFRYSYKELITELTFEAREKLLETERGIGKRIEDMMIGEFIRLFKENDLFNILSKIKNIKFEYFNLRNVNHANTIRVKCTHKSYSSNYSEANFIYFTLRNILHELKIVNSSKTGIDIDDDIQDQAVITDPAEDLEITSDISLLKIPRPEYTQFIGRESYIDEVIEKLTGRGYLISIDGIGGVGKSALALEVGNLCWKKKLFESIIWVSAKKQTLRLEEIKEISPDIDNFNDLLDAILEIHQFEDAKKFTIENKEKNVKELLKTVKTLIIIDNLETVEDLQIFGFLLDLPEPSKALITSRKRLGEVERVVVLKEFSIEETIKFLKVECNEKKIPNFEPIKANIQKIHDKTGGIPLALKIIVGWLASGISIKEVLKKISDKESNLLKFCFNESYNILSDKARQIFCILPIFSEDYAFKDSIAAASNIHGDLLDKSLSQLLQLSLINIEKKFDDVEGINIFYYSMLPLTLNFAYVKLTERTGCEGDARRRLAKYYQSHSQPKDALKQYRKSYYKEMDLRTEKGKTAVVLSNLAFSTYQRGDLRKARRLFKRAIDTDPRLAYSYQLFATVERQQGNYTYAEKLFQKAAKLNPKNPIIWSNWAMMKKEINDLDGSSKLLIKGINEIKKHNKTYLFQQLAVVESMRGNYEKAITIAEDHLNFKPNNQQRWENTLLMTVLLETYWKWAMNLFNEKKYGPGYEKLELGLEISQNNRNIVNKYNKLLNEKIKKIFYTFGIKKSMGGNYTSAENLFNKALYLNPKNEDEKDQNCRVEYHRILNFHYWGKLKESRGLYKEKLYCLRKFPRKLSHLELKLFDKVAEN